MIQLVISFEPETKQVQVSGPINDRMLSYSMLEMARDAIKDFSEAKKNESRIIEAVSVPFNGSRG